MQRNFLNWWSLLGVASISVLASTTQAQQDGISLPTADTSSPRATLTSFIEACNELAQLIETDRHFDRRSFTKRPVVRRILDCFDESELPDYVDSEMISEAAVCLKEVLDRVKLPPFDEIPDAKDFESGGDNQKSPRWQIPGTRLTIAKVEQGPQAQEFLFTPGTIERAPKIFEEIRELPYRSTGPGISPGFYGWYSSAPGHPAVATIVDLLPEWSRSKLFGLTIWQWIGLIFVSALTVFLMILMYRWERQLAARWMEKSTIRYGLTILPLIFAILLPLGYRHFVEEWLTLRGTPLSLAGFTAGIALLAAISVAILGAGNRLAAIIIASPRVNPDGLNAQLIRIVCKLLAIISMVIVLLEGGRFLGIPVTTLLASAGVGGFAIALAAQDTLKTLFGTVMLLADKPFRVGDEIVFEKYDGVVEDIGLRSTTIRLEDGNIIYIPNDELAGSHIENIDRRRHIRRTATLELPSDTAVTDVRYVLDEIRKALDNHQGMEEEFPPRVFLRDINETSIGIVIIYWYHPGKYWEYLEFSEKLNLLILEKLEGANIPFASPVLAISAAKDVSTREIASENEQQR